MDKRQSTFWKRGLKAGILALFLFAVLSLSAVFELHEADHACTGDDCPVCEVLAVCEQLHTMFEVVLTAAASLTAAGTVYPVVRRIPAVMQVMRRSSVSVRLNC